MSDSERRLYLAILTQAVCDFHGLASVTGAEIRTARAWIRSNLDAPMSFVFVCSVLDLDPQAVRERVQRANQKGLALAIRGNWYDRLPEPSGEPQTPMSL